MGKNAADIALVVDAMDLLYGGTERFCLVTTDSDYAPLVLLLRSAGGEVLVIGRPSTPLALKNACSSFVSTNELLPPPPEEDSAQRVVLRPLLLSAYEATEG